MSVTPHSLGAVLGAVQIMGILQSGPTAGELVYLVKHTCCGAVVEMTHRQVANRHANGVRFCQPCGVKFQVDNRRPARTKPAPDIRGQRLRPPGSFTLIADLPVAQRPRPRITDADIERHLARVFPW
jgi:hypothetical protein